MSIDKIGIVVTMLAQLGVSVWWASGVDTRLSTVETGRAERQERFYKLEQAVDDLGKNLDRLNNTMSQLNNIIIKLEGSK